MKIGLLRHFPVDQAWPTGWRTAMELREWVERYDVAPVVPGAFDLGGIEWRACLSSDLPRAHQTAGAVFARDVELTPLLREPTFHGFPTGGLRLPVWAWAAVLRASWWIGHRSQRTSRDEFRDRVRQAADRLCGLNDDTLVVSHAGMMSALARELKRRGFRGPRFGRARHAQVYVFERR